MTQPNEHAVLRNRGGLEPTCASPGVDRQGGWRHSFDANLSSTALDGTTKHG